MKNLLLNKKFQFPILMFLIGLILMMSADIIFPNENSDPDTDNVPIVNKGDSNRQDKSQNQNIEQQRKDLENRIQELIESMADVKNASVVITYENSGELYTNQDSDSSSMSTKEDDGEGGNREINEETNSDRTIYIEGSDGSRYPFVISEKYAQIRGVAVVVNGAYSETSKEKIVRALEVLLNLPVHKIQVIW